MLRNIRKHTGTTMQSSFEEQETKATHVDSRQFSRQVTSSKLDQIYLGFMNTLSSELSDTVEKNKLSPYGIKENTRMITIK